MSSGLRGHGGGKEVARGCRGGRCAVWVMGTGG